jgi:fructose-bisphosphate aldolase, class I
MHDLADIAQKLVSPGKGILAADESVKSADARLASYDIQPGAESRQKFRDLFLAAPGTEEYLTGVILHEETLMQDALDGKPFREHLASRGIIPGIKVDTGTEPMPESRDELITNGLIGLPERLKTYRSMYGAGFTKWRAVIRIRGTELPSSRAIHENAKRLSEYARLVQEAGMVPMVEPEVLLEGNHSRLRAKEVIAETMSVLMDTLSAQAVDLSAVIVKTSMALSGSESKRKDTPEEVAEDTLEALMGSVSPRIPGIVFLSGGQTPDQATDNLGAITGLAQQKGAPWPLTFSYSRALQDEALRAWGGRDADVEAARKAFLERLQQTAAALSAG